MAPWPALSWAPRGLPLEGQRGSQIYEPASQSTEGGTELRPQLCVHSECSVLPQGAGHGGHGQAAGWGVETRATPRRSLVACLVIL